MGAKQLGTALICASAAACGGGGGISGTALGTPYQVSDSFFVRGGEGTVTFFLSNDDNLCAKGHTSGYLQNVQLVLVGVGIAGGGALEPGDYTVAASGPPGEKLAAAQAVTLAICEFGSPATATSGTVTLRSAGPTFDGSVDLGFPGGGRLTGSFVADECGGPFGLEFQYCE